MAKVRRLSERQFLHLIRVAAGLLTETDGDLRKALAMAMVKHRALLRLIHDEELVADVGPGNAILFVPEEGGLALRLERHPRPATEDMPTEEANYPEIDLLGFEVIETKTSHTSQPNYDAGVIGVEDWD